MHVCNGGAAERGRIGAQYAQHVQGPESTRAAGCVSGLLRHVRTSAVVEALGLFRTRYKIPDRGFTGEICGRWDYHEPLQDGWLDARRSADKDAATLSR